MEMFNKKIAKERIGPLKKSKSLDILRDVEIYFLKQMKKFKTEVSYDVIAQEMPYFKTLGYTEYATNFIIHPLNFEMRMRQMQHAWEDNVEDALDFSAHLKKNIENKIANKYQDRKSKVDKYDKVGHLVVLAGSNKLKENVCLNKLKYIRDKHDTDVYFKPHPITTYAVIGELKDILGEDRILPRDIDMYHFLQNAHKVYTTHMSESAIYSIALGKEIEPIDVYNKVHRGSFYHINRFLFECQANEVDGNAWINRTFSSYKSGVFNPVIDKNWKSKLDSYLNYIHDEREKFTMWYVDTNEK
jgi:hypothetical protein